MLERKRRAVASGQRRAQSGGSPEYLNGNAGRWHPASVGHNPAAALKV